MSEGIEGKGERGGCEEEEEAVVERKGSVWKVWEVSANVGVRVEEATTTTTSTTRCTR